MDTREMHEEAVGIVAPMTAKQRLEARRQRRAEEQEAQEEPRAEKQLRVEDLLEAHTKQFGSATIPKLDKADDKRDPRDVYVAALMDHSLEDIERAFCELGRAAVKTKVALVPTGAGFVIVRGPTEQQYKRFKRLLFKEETKAEASETLVVACGVWPPSAELHSMLRATPVVADLTSARCIDLGGGATDPK
jgi:hypothetical protein